ncbi:MAG: MobP3 family relaxase [Lachnospiraceae bacterium]
MSLLVYKQRFQNPNYKSTASKNYAHIRYIATRPRVAKNEGMNHGLFGKMTPGAIEEFKDWRDIARQVYRNSKKHIVMYRSIISFDEDTAKELMLKDQKAWQRYIENHIMTIAEKNNIKREHLQWACALHQEKKHPHIHVVFWDTSRVRNPYTPPAIPNAIRRQMIKDTFAERIRSYGEQKNLALRSLRQIGDELVDEFDWHIRKQNQSKRKSWLAELEHELDGDFDWDESVLAEIAERIFSIKEQLPEHGRIAYQLLPPECKEQVDQLVGWLLNHIPTLEQKRQDYTDSKMRMVQLYGGDKAYMERMQQKFAAEADRVIANKILGMVKRLNRVEAEERGMEAIRNRKIYYAEHMILEILEMLSSLTDSSEQQWEEWHKKNQSELSKEARKELFLKLQDKGYEH